MISSSPFFGLGLQNSSAVLCLFGHEEDENEDP
jgi:hypothetical protein